MIKGCLLLYDNEMIMIEALETMPRKSEEIKSHHSRGITLGNSLVTGIPDLVIVFGVPKISDNDGSLGESCFL